jgi:hypothetical protein
MAFDSGASAVSAREPPEFIVQHNWPAFINDVLHRFPNLRSFHRHIDLGCPLALGRMPKKDLAHRPERWLLNLLSEQCIIARSILDELTAFRAHRWYNTSRVQGAKTLK